MFSMSQGRSLYPLRVVDLDIERIDPGKNLPEASGMWDCHGAGVFQNFRKGNGADDIGRLQSCM